VVAGDESQRHAVVFDCNVYLDVARLIGPPFSWEKLSSAAAKLTRIAVPHPTDPAHDSLRAIAMCTSGKFAGEEVLEVWTNSHIDKVVRGKAQQPTTPNPVTGYRGLGWSHEHAQALVDELIGTLIGLSNGGTLGAHHPDGNPPLDHEDGMVYGACRSLSGEDPLCRIYCVTRDKGFLDAYTSGALSNHSIVLAPGKFVALLRAARVRYSIRGMRPN
jgi:hypothetical protein